MLINPDIVSMRFFFAETAKERRILTLSAVAVEKVFFSPESRKMPLDLMTRNVSEIENVVYRAS